MLLRNNTWFFQLFDSNTWNIHRFHNNIHDTKCKYKNGEKFY